MSLLGLGLSSQGQYEDALAVQQAELSTERRIGGSEKHILVVQGNLAGTYSSMGRVEEALPSKREVYSGWSKLYGEDHERTLRAASNYANCLVSLRHFEEAKSLLRKKIPVARRTFGESNEVTLRMRWGYAEALCRADGATLGDTREAVATLEDLERTTQRVMGGAHPTTASIGRTLQNARAALSAREAA